MTDTAPWTIKSVPIEIRQKAVKAANAQGQTMAQWLADAVNRLADQQANNAIIPPSKPPAPMPLPEIDLAGLGSALQAVTAAYQASCTVMPKSLGREAATTLRRYLRAVRGLPERQTGGQTKRQIGQTVRQIEGGDV